jgi:hypothetical protein
MLQSQFLGGGGGVGWGFGVCGSPLQATPEKRIHTSAHPTNAGARAKANKRSRTCEINSGSWALVQRERDLHSAAEHR